MLCAVLVICGLVFGIQAAKSSKTAKIENKTSVSLSASSESSSEAAVVAGGSFDDAESKSKAQSSENDKNQSAKSKTSSTTARSETKTTKKSGDSVGAAQKNNNKEQAEEPQKKKSPFLFQFPAKTLLLTAAKMRRKADISYALRNTQAKTESLFLMCLRQSAKATV